MYRPEPSIQSTEPPSWVRAPGKFLTTVVVPVLMAYLLRVLLPKLNQ